MDTIQLLEALNNRGLLVEVDGDGLYVSPGELLDDNLRSLIRENKAEIIKRLTSKTLEALPHECPCLWNSACLPPPNRCVRCGQFAICPNCHKCRDCWLARVVRRQVVIPDDP
jgi:hypothetical protein